MNTRRSFLKSLAVAGAATVFPAGSYLRAQGANSSIRVAGIGVGGRGAGLFKGALEGKLGRIVALCDVDPKRVAQGKVNYEADPLNAGQTVQAYSDFRRLLESKEIDAVMIATPNHWHTLAAIWAMQAGKDVYVEKPVSHTLWEGRQLVAAAAKYGRIVQSGTQSRSSGGLKAAADWLKGSPLGRLKYARGTCFKRRPSIGKASGVQALPDGIDHDLWCGPAAVLPLNRAKLHYDWHWVWEYGNGDLGNQGVHQADIARWFMGEEGLPKSAISVGGRLGYEDDGETPNTQMIAFDYQKAPMYFEVHGLPKEAESKEMDSYRGSQIGVVLQYENGHVLIPNYTSVTAFDSAGNPVHYFGTAKPAAGQGGIPSTEGGKETHAQNFLNAVASRNAAALSCPPSEGHLSAALCHMAGISHRLGRTASADEIQGALKSDAEAQESVGRMFEHLKANLVDLAKTPLTLGARLDLDRSAERFVKNDAANAMLHRKDRKGFEVPKLAV
jgi:predicted dehydrogenase